MIEVTRLKSTRERVVVLEEFTHEKAGQMARVKLPPQQSWHKHRIQNVRLSNLTTERSNI